MVVQAPVVCDGVRSLPIIRDIGTCQYLLEFKTSRMVARHCAGAFLSPSRTDFGTFATTCGWGSTTSAMS